MISTSPRLTDVAQAAGVSVATASRALSGRGSVASETRDRVRRMAADLDFHPSAAGQTLRTRSTRMIGFIVPDLALGGLSELRARGVSVPARRSCGCGQPAIGAHATGKPPVG